MAASVGDASLAVGVKAAFLLGKKWVAAAKAGASALANSWVLFKQIPVASTFHKCFGSLEQSLARKWVGGVASSSCNIRSRRGLK
jgi:hypothetical protein